MQPEPDELLDPPVAIIFQPRQPVRDSNRHRRVRLFAGDGHQPFEHLHVPRVGHGQETRSPATHASQHAFASARTRPI